MYLIPARPTMRRLLILLLLLISILILLYNVPTSSLSRILPTHPQPPSAKELLEKHYQNLPIYEYTSLYRTFSSKKLERNLDAQLRRLERSTRRTLPKINGRASDVASKTIWQFHTPAQAKSYSKWIEQWSVINPHWKHRAILLPFHEIFMLFTGVPELVGLYMEVEALREDLLRWLVLWYFGGLAAEIDTWDRIGIEGCEPLLELLEGGGNGQKKKDIGLVVGVETDEPFLDQSGLTEFGIGRAFGFGTAIIWAPKRFDPFLRRAIVRTVSHARAQMDTGIEGLKGRSNRTEDFIEELSGKHMFTDVILEILTETLPPKHGLRDQKAGLERRVTWKHFKGLEEAVWVDESETVKDKKGKSKGEMQGLGVLPVRFWGSGQNHSEAGEMDGVEACVNHAAGLRPPG